MKAGDNIPCIFDTEFIAQSVFNGFRIGDVPISNGIQTICVLVKYILQRSRIFRFRLFEPPAAAKEKR